MADLDRRKTIAALDRNGFAGRSRLPWRCARAAGLAGALVIACGIATILYLRGLAQELDGSPTGKVNHDVTGANDRIVDPGQSGGSQAAEGSNLGTSLG